MSYPRTMRTSASATTPDRASGSAQQTDRPAMGVAIAVGLGFTASVVAVAIGFAHLKGISVANLTRDPAAVLGGPAYIGFASHTGVVLWIAASAIAFFGGLLASQMRLPNNRFLYVAGALSLLLGLDDLMMLHEDILPRIGIPQMLVLLAYASFAMVFVLRCYREILSGSYVLFSLAALCLGTSLLIDLALPYSELEAAVEDCAKLFGITFWFLYILSETTALVRRVPRARQ